MSIRFPEAKPNQTNQTMRTIFSQRHVIATLALAILFGICGANSALAAKSVFERTKPHVNVGTIEGEPVEMWFHSNASVSDNGEASGVAQIRVVDGESFLYRIVAGEAIVESGTVLQLILILERVGEDGLPFVETDLAVVRPSSTISDCLIYDFVGPNVHLEVEGTLSLRHEHVRP
jgi:hypothetical protein